MTFDTDVTLSLPEELMAACNIRNIDASLLRKMKARAAEEGLTLRDWSIQAFVRALEEHGKSNAGRNASGGATVTGNDEPPSRGQLPALSQDRGSALADPVPDAKCFCGAQVYLTKTAQGVTKWKCEKGHWITPKRSEGSGRGDE